jgi:polysaccharide biosynthesis transport protein
VADGFAREVRQLAIEERREQVDDAVASIRGRIRRLESTTSNPVARTARRAALKEQISQLEAQAELARPIEIVRFASPPGSPASPRPLRNAALGLIVGLTLAISAAFVRDALDRRLRRSAEIQEHLGLPLLGHLSESALGSVPGANGAGRRLSDPDLEAARILRVNLDFVFRPRPRSIAVTSGLPEEGKSTVAIALASVSATAGRRTLLVECDLRRPAFTRRLGIAPEPGLTQYLDGLAGLDEIMQEVALGPALGFDGVGLGGPEPRTVGSSLVCVPAGRPTDHPADMLGSARFPAFLDEVGERFEFVVLDTAPLLSVVDTRELLPHVGGVLLCVRAASTTDDEAKAAKQALEYLPDRPIALVVTGVRKGEEGDYGYYSYAYTYGST